MNKRGVNIIYKDKYGKETERKYDLYFQLALYSGTVAEENLVDSVEIKLT